MNRGVADAVGLLTVVDVLRRRVLLHHSAVNEELERRLFAVEGERGGPVTEDLLGERGRVVGLARNPLYLARWVIR